MQTFESIKEAVAKNSSVKVGKSAWLRTYAQIVANRNIKNFGISIGNEQFMQLWCPDDSAPFSEFDTFEKWLKEDYPGAVFLLFTGSSSRKVSRSTFFYMIRYEKRMYQRNKSASGV